MHYGVPLTTQGLMESSGNRCLDEAEVSSFDREVLSNIYNILSGLSLELLLPQQEVNALPTYREVEDRCGF